MYSVLTIFFFFLPTYTKWMCDEIKSNSLQRQKYISFNFMKKIPPLTAGRFTAVQIRLFPLRLKTLKKKKKCEFF